MYFCVLQTERRLFLLLLLIVHTVNGHMWEVWSAVPCDLSLSGETASALDWEARRRLAILLNT